MSSIKKGETGRLIWHQLTPPWQACIEEAWRAYCRGSLPIGSVITDMRDRILARGRNCIHDEFDNSNILAGHRLAHAELNAILQVEWDRVDPQTCILYSTTEPCPLCVGAIRMALISEVRYASRDHTAGSTLLFEITPFFRRGNIKVTGPQRSDLETILTGMLVEFALNYADNNAVPRYVQLTSMDSDGVQLGKALFRSKQLRQWENEGKSASFVLDQLAAYLL